MEQKELNKIIAKHIKWLTNRRGGVQADLSKEDLRGVNLSGVNLSKADLSGVNLSGANLRGANLSRATLSDAILSDTNLISANLSEAILTDTNLNKANLWDANLNGTSLYFTDLREADLSGANLKGVELPAGMYQVVGIGNRNRCVTYDAINDIVICGWWTDSKENNLDSFITRIEILYNPKNGEKPNSVYYAEYMTAINFFKAMKELNEKS